MATNDRSSCPAALDLLDYDLQALPGPEQAQIAAHVQQCGVCSAALRKLRAAGAPGSASAHSMKAGEPAVPEVLRRASAGPAGRFRAVLAQLAPPRMRLGQIWSTRRLPISSTAGSPDNDRMPRFVVLLDAGPLEKEGASAGAALPSLAVAPISLDTAYQSDRDLLVPAEGSSLGYPFMVEVWNEVTMLKEQLGRSLGQLQQPFKRSLGLLYRAQLGADVDLRPLAAYLGPGISSEEDARFAFQEDEREACEYLREPLLQALAESQMQSTDEPAAIVRRLLREHLPSAFPAEQEGAPELTIGDVAARIQADEALNRALPASDRMANRSLLENPTAVPGPVTVDVIARLKADVQSVASERYWELFRRAAVALGMARLRSQTQLAAARHQRPAGPRAPANRRGRRPKEQE